MSTARGGLMRLWIWGALVILAAGAGLFGLHWWVERGVAASTPRLDGKESALHEALGFPSKDFPSIPAVERDELDKLIPIDRPIWVATVPVWTWQPVDQSLGAPSTRQNAPLQEALDMLRRHEDSMREPDAGGDGTGVAGSDDFAKVKERLARADEVAVSSYRWLIAYNRGVVYRWQGNRQRAAHDFAQAYSWLRPRVNGAASDEVLSAAIHVLYGWGESLIRREADGNVMVPSEAVDRLRDAVIWSTTLVRRGSQDSVGHAAEFFRLRPTGLSTGAIRNDLLAAYLEAGAYTYTGCGTPFTPAVCEQRAGGRCGYRNETFCKAKTTASDVLRGLFTDQLTRLENKQTTESTVWALQNVVEMESENILDREPEVSYNIAHLLLRLKEPRAAYRYLNRLMEALDPDRITPPIERLTFVTSILSGAPSAPIPVQRPGTPSAFRIAHREIYGKTPSPPPFEPLMLDDDRKAKSLDAWLFIRRYRSLLERGDYESFAVEYERLMAFDVPRDFLRAWKAHVATECVKRAVAARAHASAETAALIDAFLARSDLFSSSELKTSGVSRPFFWRNYRWAAYGPLAVAWVALVLGYAWLTASYRRLFVSAYARDREARPVEESVTT